MAHDLPTGMVLSYGPENDPYVFPLETSLDAIEVVPNYDPAGRTVVSLTWTYTVTAFIVTRGDDAANTDDVFPDIRRKLEYPAGELKVQNIGWGSIHVNGAGGRRDLMWGPKPGTLSAVNVAAQRGWRVTWRVSVCTAEQCADARDSMTLMWFNYSVSWAVRTDGTQTRTYQGSIRIPQTRRRQADRRLQDNADAYRSAVNIPVTPYFRRVPGSWQLSEDKCELKFTIVDERLPSDNAPPPDVIDVKASHSMNAGQSVFVEWKHAITGAYTLQPGVPRELSFNCFQRFLNSRLAEIRAQFRRAGGRGAVVPTDFSVAETEVYGSQVGTFSYRFRSVLPGPLVRAGIARMIRVQAMWLRPPDSAWRAWADSLVRSGAWSPRGIDGMEFRNGDDQILDLCIDREPQPLQQGGVGGNSLLRPPPNNPRRVIEVLGDMQERDLTPDESWLHYEMRVTIEEHDDIAVLKLLPTSPVASGGGSANGDVDANGQTSATTGFRPPYSDAPDHLVQYRAAPMIYVILEGTASRAAYEITPPSLASAFGADVVPANDGPVFTTGLIGNGGVPIVKASWRLRYCLTALPSQPVHTPGLPNLGPGPSGDKNKPSGPSGFPTL